MAKESRQMFSFKYSMTLGSYRFALIFFSLSISSFISCKKAYVKELAPDGQLTGLWTVFGSPDSTDPARLEISKFMLNKFLNLQQDSTFTSNITGQFDFGTYKAISSTGIVKFKSHNGSVYNYRLRLGDHPGRGVIYDSITLPGNLHSREAIEYQCSVHKYEYGNLEDNPFSVKNNQWRIPAKSSESDSLLKVRMANHIDYWIAFLKTADALELKELDMRNISTPFHFYATGLTISKVEKWPASFLSLFYHKKEAQRAYDMTVDAIYSIQYEKNEDAYLQGIDLFTKIKQALIKGQKKSE